MSMSLSATENSYIEIFPAEVPMKAAQGFIVTAVINLVISGSTCSVALVGGALAVTSTIIEALARPIINAVFPENQAIAQLILVVMPKLAVLNLAVVIAPWVGVAYKMNSILWSVLAWVCLNNSYYQRNLAMAEVL